MFLSSDAPAGWRRTTARAVKALMGLAAGLAALAAGLAALALEAAPRGPVAAGPGADDLGHVRQLLRQHDPRRARPGSLHVLAFSPTDLQLLAGHAAHLAGGAARVSLGAGQLQLQASVPAPTKLFGGWFNLQLQLADGDTLPTLERVQIGRLRVPPALAGWLLERAVARWDQGPAGSAPLHEMVQGVHLRPQRAQLIVRWQADMPARALAWLMPPAQQARLRAYQQRLAELSGRGRGPLELVELLSGLGQLAMQRSPSGQDAAAENRALLMTLALYATGRPLGQLLPLGGDWPRPRWRPLLLGERVDFSQHLLVSAVLAAEGGGALADALGLAKEVDDARHGSGFSFNDLAVNRAGVRLGQQALRAPRELQARLAAGVRAAELLPDVSDLPEFLPEPQFLQRYGGVGAPAYRDLLADIEARIAALPLYR